MAADADALINLSKEPLASPSEEVARLRQRVTDLEYVVAEYQMQMSSILRSSSWRATAPLRASTRLLRSGRFRVKAARQRFRSRKQSDQVLLDGLITTPRTASATLERFRGGDPLVGLTQDAPLSRPTARVVLLVHVHYPELWVDISDRLVRIPMPFDLVVTVTEGTAESAIPAIRRHCPDAKILVVPNRGRDWGPTLKAVRAGLISGYDAVAKVHTKKSEHRVDGSAWRLELLDGVLESPAQIQRIVDLLSRDPTVGAVAPHRHIASTESWGSNHDIIVAMAETLPMPVAADALKFPAGSMFWCRPWLLERLTDFELSDDAFGPEGGQLDGTLAHAIERLIGVLCQSAGLDVVDSATVGRRLRTRPPLSRPAKVFSFYYPQFHAIAENDRFWGPGFTDWVNVRKSRPLFDGHRQPPMPHSAIGEYDLSDPSVLKLQTGLARDHGVDGFIFHYYWFGGHRVLEAPLQNLLADTSIDMPFALNWANESWTRRWDGLDDDVLLHQEYIHGWEAAFFRDIAPAMKDPRYITINGLPLLMVYRLGELPDPASSVLTLKKFAVDEGLGGLHVIAVNPSRHQRPFTVDLLAVLDGVCSFPPGDGVNIESIRRKVRLLGDPIQGDVFTYDLAFDFSSAYDDPVPHHPGVFPGWDNTPRRGPFSYTFHGSNPATWRKHLSGAMRRAGEDGTIVFINSWNEWAEGACLEPSERFGTAFLRTLFELKRLYAQPSQQESGNGDVTSLQSRTRVAPQSSPNGDNRQA